MGYTLYILAVLEGQLTDENISYGKHKLQGKQEIVQ